MQLDSSQEDWTLAVFPKGNTVDDAELIYNPAVAKATRGEFDAAGPPADGKIAEWAQEPRLNRML